MLKYWMEVNTKTGDSLYLADSKPVDITFKTLTADNIVSSVYPEFYISPFTGQITNEINNGWWHCYNICIGIERYFI